VTETLVDSTLTLGALTTAAAAAREHARTIVGDWAMACTAEDVTLVVSELVTNAVAASTDADGRPRCTDISGGPPVIHLRLRSDRTRIVIEVWDQGRGTPEVEQPGQDAENGRGLLFVEAFSERWGWDQVPGWPGKVVWAEMSVVTQA
jgi:signal transduction histidine kinase